MTDCPAAVPESSAVRVALWRALHVQIDAPPHVLEDEIGLRLVAPESGWQQRPDMHPEQTKLFRASIVGRARFIENLIEKQSAQGVRQYVLLGAGLDTLAQRRADLSSRLKIFEVDQPGPQAWKKQRLQDLGFGVPDGLRFVPTNFERGEPWWDQLQQAGFDARQPAVVASTGVSMYLTREANAATLRTLSSLAPGSTLAMTFIIPFDQAGPEERARAEAARKGARVSGTPFVSFFMPDDLMGLAREAGFGEVRCVSGTQLGERYFAGRSDGLRPGNSEAILLATP